jgi:hypothetical protein
MHRHIKIATVAVALVAAGATGWVVRGQLRTTNPCYLAFDESGGFEMRDCTFTGDPATGRSRLVMGSF